MVKIHQLSGTALRNFLSDLKEGLGRETSLLVNTTPKVDGQAYRIAWMDGKTFMELSHTGLLDKDAVKMKGELRDHEKNFYEYNDERNSKKMTRFLK